MSLSNDPPFALGQTLGVSLVTDGTGWVGCVKEFVDTNPITGTIRSNRPKVCVAVRNTSGAALLPKRVVRLAGTGTALFGAADGYAAVAGEEFVGVVDEFLPASGVAANDVFWATVNGPTEVAVALSGSDITVRSRLAVITAATAGASAAGRVTIAPLTTGADAVGVIAYAASVGATTGSAVLAFVNTPVM